MSKRIEDNIPASEITPIDVFLNRRRFIQLAAGVGSAALWPNAIHGAEKLPSSTSSAFGNTDKLTPFEAVSQYNNFYEFSTAKDGPAKLADSLNLRPWTVSIDGEVGNPKVFDIEDLLKLAPMEERIYRMRCVETWSMVIPWLGFPLATLLKQVAPTSKAKYVEFISLYAPEQMPGQKSTVLEWPYREGLRIDEAMHPLSLLSFGLYGEILPKQNGAPIRLVVPWKYGFKSAKSIVKIRLLAEQPTTSWMRAGPNEYGFYANVNPAVDHPRWSQAKERRIGEFLKRPTLPFNGYAEQVAQLYSGMDLSQNF